MKEALGSSETSVLTRATRRNIPEDTILHSHRCENLKYYMTMLPFEKTRSTVFSEKMGGLFTCTFMSNAKWLDKPSSTACVDV
jgi:hypothetical protein